MAWGCAVACVAAGAAGLGPGVPRARDVQGPVAVEGPLAAVVPVPGGEPDRGGADRPQVGPGEVPEVWLGALSLVPAATSGPRKGSTGLSSTRVGTCSNSRCATRRGAYHRYPRGAGESRVHVADLQRLRARGPRRRVRREEHPQRRRACGVRAWRSRHEAVREAPTTGDAHTRRAKPCGRDPRALARGRSQESQQRGQRALRPATARAGRAAGVPAVRGALPPVVRSVIRGLARGMPRCSRFRAAESRYPRAGLCAMAFRQCR